MVDLAKSYDHLKKMNNDSYSDPRLNLIIGDGFYYARTSNEKYDAIYIDFPYPKNNDLAKLYSVEFYTFVKRLLRDDNSYVVMDVPIIDLKDKTVRDGFYDIYREYNDVLFSSFSFAGFETLQPYRIDSETFMFLKIKKEKINLDEIKSDKFSPSVQFKVDQINTQLFDYKIDKKFINSVFKPKLME
jgi:spermidine synthase